MALVMVKFGLVSQYPIVNFITIRGDDRILLFETSGFILSQAEDDVKC